MTTIRLNSLMTLLAAGSMLALATVGEAASIRIQFTGVDLEYDSTTSTLVDAAPSGADPDPLLSANILVDGAIAGPTILPPNLSIDLEVPGVAPIALPAPGAATVVGSAGGGTLNLSLGGGGGDFLSLNLNPASIGFINNDHSPAADVVFGGAVAGVSGQQLPLDLEIGDPVSVSFSTQVNSMDVDANDMITGFTSDGTGEIRGTLVPEPSSAGLVVLASLLAGVAGARYRLG